MKVTVCDNDEHDLALLVELLAKYSSMHPEYSIETSAFTSPFEMLCEAESHGGSDLLILDIYMDGISGASAARELRASGSDAEIIFVTTSKDHALEAFALDAAKYIVKPCTEAVLFSSLDKVFSHITAKPGSLFTLKTTDGYVRIHSSDVLYTETGRNNYQDIHTLKGGTISVRATARGIYDILSEDGSFARCGVSYNINLKHVRTISKETLIFDTGISIPIPHRSYQQIKEKFLSYGMDKDF